MPARAKRLARPSSPICMNRTVVLAGAFCGALAGQVLPVSESAQPPALGRLEQPFDAANRFRWAVKASLGPGPLLANAVASGIGTAANVPREYGAHWDSFGHRYGNRVLTGATSAAIEVAAGSLWGEDPRYVPAAGKPLGRRLTNVVISAFVARDRRGRVMPAYGRYVAYSGTTFLSNEWRPDSETALGDTLVRIPMSFATRMAKNALSEFLPDVYKHLPGK